MNRLIQASRALAAYRTAVEVLEDHALAPTAAAVREECLRGARIAPTSAWREAYLEVAAALGGAS